MGYSGGILLIAAIATYPPLLWQTPIRPSEHHESFLALQALKHERVKRRRHHLHAERFQVLVRYLIWFSLGVVAQIPTKGVAPLPFFQLASNGVSFESQ